jgi:hypothetical protein
MFGQVLSLKEYISENDYGILTSQNIAEASLNLTERLVVEKHLASPIFLNMIVAALLLQKQSEVYLLDQLVKDC